MMARYYYGTSATRIRGTGTEAQGHTAAQEKEAGKGGASTDIKRIPHRPFSKAWRKQWDEEMESLRLQTERIGEMQEKMIQQRKSWKGEE